MLFEPRGKKEKNKMETNQYDENYMAFRAWQFASKAGLHHTAYQLYDFVLSFSFIES